jgi:hypothetical protein
VYLEPFGVRRVTRAVQVFHEPDSGAPRVPLLRCCLHADALPAGQQLKRYCPRPRPARFENLPVPPCPLFAFTSSRAFAPPPSPSLPY